MNPGTVARLHRLIGLGMDMRAVEELAAQHLDSIERRQRLTPMAHAEFLLNNLIRRANTPPRSDLGAHFLPALAVTAVGMGIYLSGGQGPHPNSTPGWPLFPLGIGLLWLIVQTCRARGFPTRGAIGPSLVMGTGALADAIVMDPVVPEDHLIRVGLVLMGFTQPLLFILLSRRSRSSLGWPEMRRLLLAESSLAYTWYLLSAGIALVAAGELLALARYELPNSLQVGALISGVGLAWMAQSFVVATRPGRRVDITPDRANR
jgi:hypothetical protein